jgi:DNA-directed RNA polymerase specialized sigma24 family protein
MAARKPGEPEKKEVKELSVEEIRARMEKELEELKKRMNEVIKKMEEDLEKLKKGEKK